MIGLKNILSPLTNGVKFLNLKLHLLMRRVLPIFFAILYYRLSIKKYLNLKAWINQKKMLKNKLY
jgi:hypothetical protein